MPYVRRTGSNYTEALSDTIKSVVNITNAAGTTTLPDIIVPEYTGALARVIMELNILCLQNTNAANNAFQSGTSYIQLQDSGSTWRNAITITDPIVNLAASSLNLGMITICGATDIKAYISSGTTYHIRWLDHKANLTGIDCYGIQEKLKIFFK